MLLSNFVRLGVRCLILYGILTSAVVAAESLPLSQRIDAIIQKRLDEKKIRTSPQTEDPDFLRRVYLDLTGRIPTMTQAVEFLDSTDPDKRAKLIDELLSRPEYGMYFATRWRELIVDRSDEKKEVRVFKSPAFVEWLAEGLNRGRGWDGIVTDMLTVEGEVNSNPSAAFIMSNRVNSFPRPEDIAAMTGRLFMGINVRCAQCHDHPSVDEWKQDDFWGMAAFFGQIRDHNRDPGQGNGNPLFTERPNPDEKAERHYIGKMREVGQIPPQVGPRIAIPLGSNADDIKSVVSAKYFLAEAPTLPSDGPYRPVFAAWLTSKDNPYFARAAVNRLWAHFFARGIVHPVDDMSPQNPPSHPELLDLLETEFKNADFDFKPLLRAFCNSATYQRTSRPTKDNAHDTELLSHMPIRVLDPDQLLDSFSLAFNRPVLLKGAGRDSITGAFASQEPDALSTSFSHGIPQFLQVMNGRLGTEFAIPPQTSGKKKEEAITTLYLSALARRPRPAEMQRMSAYVDKKFDAKSGGNLKGYQEVYWVLLNSAEFFVNR